MMKVDASKINLTEKDIEDYLWEHSAEVHWGYWHVVKWIKRQYSLPGGILDLWGVTNRGEWVVVEVKNVEVDAKAIAQVCRYAFDLEHIIATVDARREKWVGNQCHKLVIGPSIGTQALRECEGCGVLFLEFDVEFDVDVSLVTWSDEFDKNRDREYERLAEDGDLAEALNLCAEIQEQEVIKKVARLAEAARENEDAETDENEVNIPF